MGEWELMTVKLAETCSGLRSRSSRAGRGLGRLAQVDGGHWVSISNPTALNNRHVLFPDFNVTRTKTSLEPTRLIVLKKCLLDQRTRPLINTGPGPVPVWGASDLVGLMAPELR